jgi:SAM-dependent methyltransferase
MPSIVEFHPYPGETLRTNRKGWRERRILVREICGLSLARTTNTLGNDRDALRAYDQKFFEFYPYLDRFVRFSELKGKDVLEVGLGYGAVAQKIAESGANLTGLDISPGPVAWLQSRFDTFSLKGRAIQASILDAPFPDSSFDAIVSIGCLHMTGNLKRAFFECARVLRPGGTAVFMIYNALSYYRWFKYPGDTLSYFTRSFASQKKPRAIGEMEFL